MSRNRWSDDLSRNRKLVDALRDANVEIELGTLIGALDQAQLELVDSPEKAENEILTVLIQTSRQNLEPGDVAARISTRLKDKGII